MANIVIRVGRNLEISRTRNVAVPLLIVVLGAILTGCAAQRLQRTVDVKPAEPPAVFRSLGSSDIYFNIQGIGEVPRRVSIGLDQNRVLWFHPESLRLAQWKPKDAKFEVIHGSRFDAKTGKIGAVLAEDGLYTVLGLSRARHVFDFQTKLCKWRALAPVSQTRLLPPECPRILCPAFDARAWSGTWSDFTDMPVSPGDLREQFGNICDQCFGTGIDPGDFPECEIVDVIPGDFVPPFEFPCPDCERVCPDDDGDTVCNDYELCLGTNRNKPDTDGDGLDDGRELDIGTDPTDRDTDADTLSDGDEVNTYNTDPLDPDTDGDGLQDDWEILGYDSDSDGTRDVNLPNMGVDARHKDLLVEIDWMFNDSNNDGDTADPGENFQPQAAAINNVVNTFANAPVNNPDGLPGINLIVTISNGIQEVNLANNLLVFDAANNFLGFTNAFYNIKNANMTPGMANISRYSLWIRNFNAAGNSGIAEAIVGDDFVVSLGLFTTQGGTLRQQQSTFMHELGHTLGLYHGGTRTVLAGDPNYDRNWEPSYPSIMNYAHQFPGVIGNWTYGNPPPCVAGRGRLCFTQGAGAVWSYSQGQMADVNEACLNEPAGITVLAGPIDWNLDGDTADACVSVDLQADGDTGVQDDNDDWAGLVYKFW